MGCDCEVCRGATSSASRNYRTGSSVALRFGPPNAERLVLIDASPEFRLQASALKLRQFDALLITHAHDDHILGLSTLVNAQRGAGKRLAVYAPAKVLNGVRERFGYLWTSDLYSKVMQPEPLEGVLDLWGLEVRDLRVDHGFGGTAYGYVIRYRRARLAYIPDMLQATPETRAALAGLDLLVIGASHVHEQIEARRRSVMDVIAAQELIREVAPAQAVLTHLSHSVDYYQVQDRLPPPARLAYDGLNLEVRE